MVAASARLDAPYEQNRASSVLNRFLHDTDGATGHPPGPSMQIKTLPMTGDHGMSEHSG